MNLNDTIIRGVLDISCAAPKIRARVHGVLKPLTIESSNVVFSNNITVMNSTNTKKISGISKAGSVAMFGIFSQKVKKQWHCNHCGSDF